MPKQPAFPGLRDAMKKKRTRREQFLAEMDAVVPWDRLLALVAAHYPRTGPKGGRPPMPLETMPRVYFLQNWYALSDPMAEETLYDSEAMRRFAGIELGDDRIPDETTILNFRHLLERHGLTEAIFAEVNTHLADKGITLRSGTLVDVSGRTPWVRVSPRKIIDAPSSTKNKCRVGVQSRHLVDRVQDESIRLGGPDLADVFVGREATEGLESAGEVVGGQEVGKVCSQLVVAVVVETFDRGVLDRAVHPLDLAVGPRVVWPGQPVLYAVRLADHVEAHRPGGDGVPVPRLLGELGAVACWEGMCR